MCTQPIMLPGVLYAVQGSNHANNNPEKDVCEHEVVCLPWGPRVHRQNAAPLGRKLMKNIIIIQVSNQTLHSIDNFKT